MEVEQGASNAEEIVDEGGGGLGSFQRRDTSYHLEMQAWPPCNSYCQLSICGTPSPGREVETMGVQTVELGQLTIVATMVWRDV
jgi:hypothetical protein